MKFSQSLFSAMESNGELQGAVVLSEPLQGTYQIDLKYISGNATSRCRLLNIYCNLV